MKASQRVLHIAHGIPSYNNSLVELARRLNAKQIELQVVSHIDLSKVLVDSSASFVLLKADKAYSNEHGDAPIDTAKGNLFTRSFGRIKLNQTNRRRSLENNELKDHIANWKPDLLLIDMECHVAIIQTLGLGIKTILSSRWFSVFRSAGVPPMHTMLFPSHSPINSCRITWAWISLWGRKRVLDIKHRWSRRRFWPIGYGSDARFDLEAVADHEGLCLNDVTDRLHWLIPHVYSNLPVLSFTLSELEFGITPDERMHYVGPLVGNTNTKDHHGSSSIDEFTHFVNRRGESASRPLIYCSFSTFWQTDKDSYDVLVRLFAKRLDLDFVIGLGGNDIPEALVDSPENVLVLEFAPQLEIMKYAAIVISHGGISTINEALYHGVPLIICSSGHVDQDGCAARVAYNSVGLIADGAPLCDLEINQRIDGLLCEDDSAMRIQHTVAYIQEKMHQSESDNTVGSFIAEMINS